MSIRKFILVFGVFLMASNSTSAFNFTPENNNNFAAFTEPAEIALFSPGGVSYPGNISFFITSESGDRVNLPNDWEIVITNQTDINFVNELNNTDVGVYETFSPLIDNPPIEIEYDNGNDEPALMQVPAKYQLKNPEGEIVSFGQFSVTYPEVKYRFVKEKEFYNENEEIVVTLERQVTDFASFRPYSLPDQWLIKFGDGNGATVADTDNGITPVDAQKTTFKFQMPGEGYANEAFFQILLKSGTSLMALDSLRFSESEGQLISLSAEEYSMNDKIFIDVKNDDGNSIELEGESEIQVFYMDGAATKLVATTEDVLVDIDTSKIQRLIDKRYLLAPFEQSGSYLARVVKPADNGGYQILSVDTFILRSNVNEEDAGDENGAINLENEELPEAPEVDDQDVNVEAEVNAEVEVNNNGGGNGNSGGNAIIRPEFVNFFLEEDDQRQCVDIEDNYWAEGLISEMLEDEIYPVEFNEDDEILCRPKRNVTRKEFTAWLLAVYRPELVEDIDDFDFDYDDSPLKDIDGEDPYDNYIIIAFQNEIINGYPDGYFRPNKEINRAEVLKILTLTSGIFNNTDEEVRALKDFNNQFEPTKVYEDISRDDQYFYNYLHFASASYSDDLETFLINGRKVNVNGRVETRAAMEEPILFSEAAKIVTISKKMKERRERKIILQ